jgi:hypothetical protein
MLLKLKLGSTLAERLWRLFVGLILFFIQIFELDIPIEELLKKIFQIGICCKKS